MSRPPSADPKAVAQYVKLWGQTDISSGTSIVRASLLAIAGSHDFPHFRAEALEKTLLSHYPGSKIETIRDPGHYPMVETPPLLAALIQSFLSCGQ
jgi:pimeloyl-ACP methyl ester carboxylesterase